MERRMTALSCGWRFRLFGLGQAPDGVWDPSFDDSEWEEVRVPHDWAIRGDFREENDFVCCDMEEKNTPHSGRTGALPIVGTGVYRRRIRTGEDAESVFLEFDGVMWESDVYVNGEHVYFNHYGYLSFCADITEQIVPGADAVVTVVASVRPACSRWYPGGGIFRKVRLAEKSREHILYSGLRCTPLHAKEDSAAFRLEADVSSGESLLVSVTDPAGKTAAEETFDVNEGRACGTFSLADPVFWGTDCPALYTVKASLVSEGRVADETCVRIGVRTAVFTPDEGFLLNGVRTKIRGVCLHHDLGALGAAFSLPALKRQIRIMKEMGINSVRTSHNPPAPELLDLCDEEGILVMDEMFDEWTMPKVPNGYAKHFDKHVKDDIKAIIRRDINHPSVILWSAGNELREQKVPEGRAVAAFMAETVRSTDPSRQVAACFDDPVSAFENGLGECFDVVGMNYKPHLYEALHEKYPGTALLGSETASTVSSRGIYHLPAQVFIPARKHEDLSVSAYDLEAPFWAQNPEKEWEAQDSCPFIAGEYVWTGFDYLGEPTPYYTEWPSRSSYFGIVDTAGRPKDRYYGYMAQWSGRDVLHMFPHWNWEGMEGKMIPVHVFTTYPSAELFINGRSFGIRTFTQDSEVTRYRLVWENAVYEPGEAKVVAYDENGVSAAETSVRTAGAPARILLAAERETIASDGEDLVYVTALVTDRDGNICPHYDGRLFFEVTGEGVLAALDNGDQRDTESFVSSDKRALSGSCTAVIRSLGDRPGKITLTVRGEKLPESSVSVLSAEKAL